MRRLGAAALCAASVTAACPPTGASGAVVLQPEPVNAGRDAFVAGLVGSFGVDGRYLQIERVASTFEDLPVRVLVDSDRGVLAVTTFDVLRLSPDGRRDRSYAGPPASFNVRDAELDAAGRLVVSGRIGGVALADYRVADPAIGRLLRSGQPDPTFGTAGIARLPGPLGIQGEFTVVRPVRGGILAAGVGAPAGRDYRALVARIRGEGVPDEGFGPGGLRALAVEARRPEALDGGDGAVLTTTPVTRGGGSVLSRWLPSGSLDAAFGAGGRAMLPDADADTVAAPPRAGARIMVAWAERATGSVAVAALSRSGVLDRSFGRGGTARVRLGAPADVPSVALGPDGGLAVVAGIRGSLAAVRLDRDGHPVASFGAGGVGCMPVETQGFDGLPGLFHAQAAFSPAGLTVAGKADWEDTGEIVVARMRWRAPRALTCTSAIERGGVIRISGVRSRSGRLEIVLRKPGRRGRPGRRVGTVRFAQRGAGAHADLWNRRLHGRRLGCQALVASPRLVSAGGRVLGIDAPFAVYPNCPGPDV